MMNALKQEKEVNLLMLKTLYGKLRKLNDVIYITDTEGTNIQKIINIATGEVLMHRMVTRVPLFFNSSMFAYSDFIQIGLRKYGLIYIHADTNGVIDGCFRVYNIHGECLIEQHIYEGYTVVYEYKLDNNKLLVLVTVRKYNKNENEETYFIVYDKSTENIEDKQYYTKISKIKHRNRESIRIKLTSSKHKTFKLAKKDNENLDEALYLYNHI